MKGFCYFCLRLVKSVTFPTQKYHFILKKLGVIIASIALLFAVAGVLLLNTKGVQNKIVGALTRNFNERTHTTLSIDKTSFNLLRGFSFHVVRIEDAQKKPILTAERLDVGLQLLPLLYRKIDLDYFRLIRGTIHLSKKDEKSPLNIQTILDGYSKSKKTKKNAWDISLNSIVLRECKLVYDLENMPLASSYIDVNHLRLNNISTKFSFKKHENKSSRLTIDKLTATTEKGLRLDQLKLDGFFSSNSIRIRNVEVLSGESALKIPLMEGHYTKGKGISHLLNTLRLKPFELILSTTPSQFAFLSEQLAPLNKQIDLVAKLEGSLDKMRCSNLELNMESAANLSGSFLMENLSQKGAFALDGSIQALHVSGDGLKFLQEAYLKDTSFKVDLLAIGMLDYSGTIRASSGKASVAGLFNTVIGNLKTDVQWTKPGEISRINGKISTESLRLNELLPKSLALGETKFDVVVDATLDPNKGVFGTVLGKADHLVFKGYDFQNLSLNGRFNKEKFEGVALLRDKNGKMYFSGLVELNKQRPVYSFDLFAEGFNPFAFGLLGFQSDDSFSFHLHTNLTGKGLDDLTGNVQIDSLSLRTDKDHFFLSKLTVDLTKTLENRSIIVKSDLLNANLQGIYQLSSLKDDVLSMLNGFMPSILKYDFKPTYGSDFSFQASMKPSIALFNILKLPVQLNEAAQFQGFLNERTGKFRFKGDFPDLTYGKSIVQEAGFLLENPQKEAKLIAFAQVGNLDDPIKVNVDIRGLNDLASFKLNMANQGLRTYSGNITGTMRFNRKTNGSLALNGSLNESSLIVNDSLWRIHPTSVQWEDKTLRVSDFQLTHNEQFIKFQGTASSKETDTLHVSLNRFSLDNIFDLLTKSGVRLGGSISGDAKIAQLLGNTSLDADLKVDQFSLNRVVLGNLKATSKWDTGLKAIVLDATILNDSSAQESRLLAKGKGYYYPSKDSMRLSLDGNKLPLGFLEPYLGKILHKIDGTASGNILIQGPMKHLSINTKAFIENGSFGVEMLNTRYRFSDTVWVTPTQVYFRNVKVLDQEGHQAIANGRIRHERFQNVRTAIEISGNNLLCMNLPANPDAYFYGKAYGSGTVSINGANSEMVIDVDLKTEDNSNVTISFLDDKEVADAGFIKFINHDPVKVLDDDYYFGRRKKKKSSTVVQTKTNLTINLNIEATPVANLTLITDPNTGDDITATGSGSIRCVISENEDLSIYGRYNILRGKYKFIYENLMRRDFNVQEGGSITFAGDPFAAQLDINAAYTVNAQLANLLSSDILNSLNLNRTSIPVNCMLKLTGELQRPEISLDLAYPSADDDLVRSINDVINTEDARNQQLVFLMLFGRFSTPSYSSAEGVSSNSMSTVLNTGISTLSSQLNRIVNGVLGEENINFDFNYKNSLSDATTLGEWGVGMSGKFFNNRLTVTGNLGSRENLMQNGGGNQFIGEFDGNLKFKNSEKWSWKFFNRANDNRYFKSALNTQGVGILYREDFNTIWDLFRSKKKKEAVMPPSELDSTQQDTGMNMY